MKLYSRQFQLVFGAWFSFALLSLFSVGKTQASAPVIVLFGFASALTISVLVFRPFSSFFTALGAFFLLGFPLKFFFVALTGAEYTEAHGDFDWSQSQYDEALLVASVVFFALVVAMIADLPFRRKERLAPIGFLQLYIKIEKPLAAISIVIALGAFGSNWYYGFVKTGMDQAVILPGVLHISVSFIVLWGAALWLACMAYWAWCGSRLPMWGVLALGLVEGVLSGVSNASRARFVFHAMGFAFGWVRSWKIRLNAQLSPRMTGILATLSVVCLAVSLAVVMADRVVMYAEGSARGAHLSGTPSEEPSRQPVVVMDKAQLVSQVSRLFVARWIGMEGVMSVVGSRIKGDGLFWKGLTERPDIGNDGLYQQLSKSAYRKLPGMTFLTTAGGAAVLYYSGSLSVVFVGIFLLATAGVWIERLALFLTDSPFASSIVAVCFANFICQVNQPYTPFIFMIIMLMACGMIFSFRVLCEWLGAGRIFRPPIKFNGLGASETTAQKWPSSDRSE